MWNPLNLPGNAGRMVDSNREHVVVFSSNCTLDQISAFISQNKSARSTNRVADMPDDYYSLRFGKWGFAQVIVLILSMTALLGTLTTPGLRDTKLYDIKLWEWEILMSVLASGRLVSGWFVHMMVLFIERSFKPVLYFVYSLKRRFQNCLWLGLILIGWHCILYKRVEQVPYGKKVCPYVTKIWVCVLMGSTLWLIKTLVIEVMASHFHINTFFDRLRESLFNQCIIKILAGPKLEEGKHVSTGSISNAVANMNGIPVEHLSTLTQKNISAWTMNRMINFISTSMLTITDHETHITSEDQARSVAQKIFLNVSKPESKRIYHEDLRQFLGNEDAMNKLTRIFAGAIDTQGVSEETFTNWLVNVFRERRALVLSLEDTRGAVEKLHAMLGAVVGIVILMISMFILEVATFHVLKFLSSQLVLVSFVFGGSCKTTFEALVFFFIVHPFDVGDRCEINGVEMAVEEMYILTTVFLRHDNQRIVYPNNILSAMAIANYQRSPDMGEVIDFSINESTSEAKTTQLMDMITLYIESMSHYWQPGPKMVLRDAAELNRLKMSLSITHRINFQNMDERWKRRGLLMKEMIRIFNDLGIEYRMLPMEIRNLPSLASKRKPTNWMAP